jgi:hypothetical protein
LGPVDDGQVKPTDANRIGEVTRSVTWWRQQTERLDGCSGGAAETVMDNATRRVAPGFKPAQ